MSVYRLTPLPVGENRGRLIVSEAVAQQTLAALRQFRGNDGQHEGLLFWGGRRCDGDVLVIAAVVPNSDHGPQHVLVSASEVGRVSRALRSMGISIVAQVHSHPGADTRHSDGDDRLIVMPHEGLFSLVVGRFGSGDLQPENDAGLHQYQDGRWVQIPPDCAGAMIIVPTAMRTVR